VRDALREGVGVETWEVTGDYRVQAWELAAEFHEWSSGLVGLQGGGVYEGWGEMTEHTSLCVEAFRLRTRNVDLDPVMVMCGMLVLLVPRSAGLDGRLSNVAIGGYRGVYAQGVPVHLQEPADAMRFATNARLKEWGVRRGMFGRPISEHRRDAYRHLCLRLAVAMGGLVETRPRSGGGRGLGARPLARARRRLG
jgi:hypothetical protein